MIVVIGAHSRNVGKTSILCALLRGIPEIRWNAVKISACKRSRVAFSRFEEASSDGDRDTDRYLRAGATRAVWVRAADEEMKKAAAEVMRLSVAGGNVLVESNRIVEQLDPNFYALALDFRVCDFKDSARRHFDQADAYILSNSGPRPTDWPALLDDRLNQTPTYRIRPPDYTSPELIAELRNRLGMRQKVPAA